MSLKHIHWATFRVVDHIKGDCVRFAQLPRIAFFWGGAVLSLRGMREVSFNVLWCG